VLAPHNPNDDSVARRFMVIEISRRVREILRAPLVTSQVKTDLEMKTVRRLRRPEMGYSCIRCADAQASYQNMSWSDNLMFGKPTGGIKA
jgi:hypothetical protein